MRLSLFFIGSLFSLAGFASPRLPQVGDFVEYVYLDTSKSFAETLERQIEIIKAEVDGVVVQDRFLMNGKEAYSFEVKYKYDELPDSETYKSFLQSCEQTWKGELAQVQVPAGSFKICKIQQMAQESWMAEIPIFGVVQESDADGTFTLKSYHFAN